MGISMEEWLWFWGIVCLVMFALHWYAERECETFFEVVTGIIGFISLAMFVPPAFIAFMAS